MQSLFKSSKYCLTDGGLETSLVHNQRVVLNELAAFELLLTDSGKEVLKEYYTPYLRLAASKKVPFIFETPTWRANYDWGLKLGYTTDQIISININAVGFLCEIVESLQFKSDVVLSGCVGPRGEGYRFQHIMSIKEAYNYHYDQIKAFSIVDVDLISGLNLNYTEEAIGIVLGAKKNDLPVVISFAVKLDGKLPNGKTLRESIIEVDEKTNNYPRYYMINCTNPGDFMNALSSGEHWISRIKGIRANKSAKSHHELNRVTEHDKEKRTDMTFKYKELFQLLPDLKVLGGPFNMEMSHTKALCNLLENNLKS